MNEAVKGFRLKPYRRMLDLCGNFVTLHWPKDPPALFWVVATAWGHLSEEEFIVLSLEFFTKQQLFRKPFSWMQL